jgi:hypothetical protein
MRLINEVKCTIYYWSATIKMQSKNPLI